MADLSTRDPWGFTHRGQLCRKLPQCVADTIYAVQYVDQHYRVLRRKHGPDLVFPKSQWLTDEMIARICLEAP
jgi:hypothetical protein